MKRRVAILLFTLSLAGEAAITVAQATKPTYLSQFPSPERIRADVRGANAMETAAKHASIFRQLRQLIYDMALSQGRTDRQFTADEQRWEAEYRNARYRAVKPFGEPTYQNPKWLEVYTRYDNDRLLRDEVFKKYFSPELRKAVYVALKEEIPTSTREGSTSTPTTSPAGSTEPIGWPTAPAGGSRPSTAASALMSTLSILMSVLLYFSPTVVSWLKKRTDPDPTHGARLFFFVAIVNTFFGWTCFGWAVAWAMVLSKRFGDMFVGRRFSSAESATRHYAAPIPSSADSSDPTRMAERPRCSACNGTGRQTCPACGGRGTWSEVNGVVSCTYCIGSGRVQCMSPSHH